MTSRATLCLVLFVLGSAVTIGGHLAGCRLAEGAGFSAGILALLGLAS